MARTMLRDGVWRNSDRTVTVTLTTSEFATAVRAVAERMDVSAQSGLNHATTYARDPLLRLQEETVGTCGELAWAKARGETWHAPLNTFHHEEDGGAGSGVEIRATARENGSLIIRDNDPVDRVYVLVTGNGKEMVIRGWIRGGEARQDQWVRDPHGYRRAWFVPQSALRPVHDSNLNVEPAAV